MEKAGIPVSRWFDGVLEDKANLDQPNNIKAMVFWGHAPNSQTRLPEHEEGDGASSTCWWWSIPYPTVSAMLSDRKDGVYLLPAATQFETSGSVTASNRSLQWREKVIEPLFEAKPDHEIMYLFAQKFGYADQMFKHIQVKGDGAAWSRTSCARSTAASGPSAIPGQSPERLKLHMANQHTFDKTTLRASGRPVRRRVLRPAVAVLGHARDEASGHAPTSTTPSQAGRRGRHGLSRPLRGRARRPEPAGRRQLAHQGSEIEDGYPEFTMAMLTEARLGWRSHRRRAGRDREGRRRQVDAVNWKTDLSGGIQRVAIKHGCAPFGNAKARCVVWTFPDPVPIHREPLYTPRRDLVADYPTYEDTQLDRLPMLYKSIQEQGLRQGLPDHPDLRAGWSSTRAAATRPAPTPGWPSSSRTCSSRSTRSTPTIYGIRDGDMVWVHGPEGAQDQGHGDADRAGRPRRRLHAVPLRRLLPGSGPARQISRRARTLSCSAKSTNTVQTYGYNSVTQMQETKTTLCRHRGGVGELQPWRE